MKGLSGHASAVTGADVEQTLGLLATVEGYPSWHPDVVREVTVLERDDHGRATRATATLHLSVGPFDKEVAVELGVGLEQDCTVSLTRLQRGPDDEERFAAVWHVEAAGGGTGIRLDVDAVLDIPRLLPLGPAGQMMAESFVSAALRALAPDPPTGEH